MNLWVQVIILFFFNEKRISTWTERTTKFLIYTLGKLLNPPQASQHMHTHLPIQTNTKKSVTTLIKRKLKANERKIARLWGKRTYNTVKADNIHRLNNIENVFYFTSTRLTSLKLLIVPFGNTTNMTHPRTYSPTLHTFLHTFRLSQQKFFPFRFVFPFQWTD